ncbi:hypothetical protein [Lysobacter sp. GCM10012299]|uniref:hypothetical protein n=1 Tax=Lysobacter sp. GCM10012299 TaxID=3317333 RepID=UPI0036187E66
MAQAVSAACVCGCRDAGGAVAHAIAAALADDDIDRAIVLGLVADDAVACQHCSDACRSRLRVARDERLQALAARERYRARNTRLERRARERAEHRAAQVTPAPDAATPTTTAPTPPPALPSAAAAALARARAKAAARHKP